ncbi:hypothetical protein AR457_04555 [Streptomyces agglomeratus]|uniref:Uncharacterized protein n=1 Tax=Streptomyces agglomeratus TaxID=285458 RepID=A0A1E5P303_9ACTN|nr:hypothetical protein AS594_04655 [Streptomyces agglomeratus]OEJ43476.1 hypothetical protein AR457_04555 [Streptomyces agglomeratus]OEJ54604.1 hypothetical protein BGK72_31215 [Streptomyces agglomeratus]OEJ61976.1 hypothetical protein BGM19_32120 [Streptomyces agglomeratus]
MDIPGGFHSLGLDLDEEERLEQIWSVAEEIWPTGSDFQREVTFHTYREMADHALAGNSFYAGFCLDEAPDGRLTTASLLARLDPLNEPDAELSARGLFEALSANENNTVEDIRVPAGPGVLVLCGLEWQSEPGDDTAPSMPLARADVYLPLTRMGRLLVLSLTTPSLPDLPFYVSLLSKTAHDLTVSSATESPAAPRADGSRATTIADEVRADFG